MIIRFTIDDNDYGNEIDSFFEQFSSNLMLSTDTIDGGTYNETFSKDYLLLYKENKRLNELLNPNLNTNLPNKEDQEFLRKKIQEAFILFIQKKYGDKNVSYFIERIKITFLSFFEDKLENGEVWYWFQCSGTYVNQ